MNEDDMQSLPVWLDAAREFARIGGALSLRWFRDRSLAVERKSDDSPVTIADRSAETAIRAAITRRFPDHAIVGEEHGGTLGSRRYEWILDPIDGTKTFIRGVPLYTTLVALVVDGEPVVGVIYCPPTGEMAAAAVGHGCWNEDGERLSVSATTDLARAWMGTTDPADLLRRHPQWAGALMAQSEAVRTWADAYGYMLVARGALDFMFDPIMSPWDIAPLSVVIREAGGVFTDREGRRNDLGDSALTAATPALHRALLAVQS